MAARPPASPPGPPPGPVHPRVIMHLDMDAFFASVEQRDNPALRGLPVAVGGGEHRGVVSAASYEARRFGVRSAMPMAQARRLCPQLVVVRGRMGRYSEVSRQVMALLREVSPLVEQVSVDEAYVDLTGTQRLFGPPPVVGELLRARVREATGLTCSVGIAPNKFLAKIASDANKPDGMFILEPQDVAAFLHDLPVGRIPGVGPRTGQELARLGVRTVGDVLARGAEFWTRRLGERGESLHARARGEDHSPVVPHHEPKSSSAETTLDRDTTDKALLARWLLAHAERVGRDLRRSGLAGRTVTLKLKYSDFALHTRSRTLAEPTDVTALIFETGRALLRETRLERPVRLIGLGVSNFGHGQRQLSLLPDPDQARAEELARLDRAMDIIRDKFGKDAVDRGLLFRPKGK